MNSNGHSVIVDIRMLPPSTLPSRSLTTSHRDGSAGMSPNGRRLGIFVGYVQSGKTANFTGVLARAADAGYRLFIVLAGTINILRDQTQRRLDKELVGAEMCGD